MAKPTEQAEETWDLRKMLAALCQVAQDACDAERVPEESKQQMRMALKLPATERERGRL
jgi:hypothetical protein